MKQVIVDYIPFEVSPQQINEAIKENKNKNQFIINDQMISLLGTSSKELKQLLNDFKNVTYVGYTNNLKKRLTLHNTSKGAKFTRGRKWILIYKEKFKSKKEAISREYYIKNNRLLRNKIKNENLNTSSL